MRVAAILLLGLFTLPPSADAQRLDPPTFRSFDASVEGLAQEGPGLEQHLDEGRTDGEEASQTDVILGSILGGMSTSVLVGYVASRFHGTPCEDCGLEEGLYGFAIGFGAGSAAGAHLANHRRGPLGRSALVGVAIGVAGMFAAIESNSAEVLLAIPIAQVASAVAIERSFQRD